MLRRRFARATIVAFTLALPTSVWVAAQALQRSVYVSALGQDGAPVSSLTPGDVAVREDKVAREILRISSADQPMQLALLVDNSQAAEPLVRDYREALPAFIKGVAGDPSGAKHEISIITLADRPTINTDYTADIDRLTKGAQRIFASPGSGSLLLDGILEISQGFSKRRSPRPVIVAITTEGPELSDRHYDTVLEPLRASGAAFHVVSIGAPVNNDQNRSIVLQLGTRDSGGRYDTVLAGTALTGRLKQVAAELTHQFRVTYARPNTLIPPERVSVTAARPGLTVRGIPVKEPREGERPR